VAGHLTDDFSVARDSIALIPNGIDVGQFRVSPKRTDPHLLCRKVGIIARLSPVKGHRYLIEAMAKVVKEFPDALLYIFGEGKIKYELVKRVEKLNISEKVLFLPAVSHSAEVLQEIDIFVMPSLQEGLGLSLLEAQACGLPVIASNVGGIPTIVQHNTTGLLVPPQDVEALAEAIARVMANKNLAMMLGRQGRRAVEEKFNVQVMAEKVEAVYAKVLNHE
jgi:glycosyltransferase involved in cell wall biosynthesis